mgnify:CR=1 FL=1
MNKNIIIAAVIAAAGVGGYTWYSKNQAAQEAVAAATEAAEIAATESAAAAAEAAAEAAAAAAEAVTETATDVVEDAVDAVTEAATDVVEGATDATTDAVDAVTGAEESTESAVSDILDSLNPLSAEGFNAEKINEMIDGSALGDTVKSGLKLAVDQAAENPALVEGVVAQVKAALGL